MVNNKKIFELEDHLDRFYNSLKLLRIEPPMQRDELTKTLNELVSVSYTHLDVYKRQVLP